MMVETLPRDILNNLLIAQRLLNDGAGRAIETIARTFAGVELVDMFTSVIGEAANVSAASASTMYDDIREYEVGSRLSPVVDGGFDEAATRVAIESFIARKLTLKEIISAVKQRLSYDVKKAAGMSVVNSARHDPKRPKFARVPTGAETCEFCIMLASRGFVYHSAASGGAFDHWHSNCDCLVVPQFDPRYDVDGYDPNYYMSIWDSNLAYDEYGHVNTKGTLKNIRAASGRDDGYYEAHKAERHEYYERKKRKNELASGLAPEQVESQIEI